MGEADHKTKLEFFIALCFSALLSLACLATLQFLMMKPWEADGVREFLGVFFLLLFSYGIAGSFFSILPLAIGWFPGLYFYRMGEKSILKWGLLGFCVGEISAILTLNILSGVFIPFYIICTTLTAGFTGYITRPSDPK